MGRKGEETRLKLIETAFLLFFGSGYGAVSVDDICRHAGVKKGSFYHSFKSKEELAAAVLDHAYEQLRKKLDPVFSPELEPLERFSALCDLEIGYQRQMREMIGHVCGCQFASFGAEMAGTEPRIREHVEEKMVMIREYYHKAIQDLITEGNLASDDDAAALSEEIETYMMGQLTKARITNSLDSFERGLRSGLFRILGVAEPSRDAGHDEAFTPQKPLSS